MSHRLLLSKLLLAPVLLAQGWHVRKHIVKLPEAAGPREGVTGEGEPLTLLVLGDSAAAGVGVEDQQNALTGNLVSLLAKNFQVRWRLFAKSGETTASTLALMQQADLETVDVVITSLGVNDVTSGNSRHGFRQDTQALIAWLREHLGAQHILLSGLPPMGAFPALPHPLRWYLGRHSIMLDNTLAHIADLQGCDYLKMDVEHDPRYIAADGFHPGAPLYAEWASRAYQRILHHRNGR